MTSSLVAMAPYRKHSKRLAPGQLIYFKYSLQLDSNHAWVSGLEHELIALSSAPSPAPPAYFMVQ